MTQETPDRRALLARMRAQQALVSSTVRAEAMIDIANGRSVVSVVDGKLILEAPGGKDHAANPELPVTTA